jgi:hypothetical protein
VRHAGLLVLGHGQAYGAAAWPLGFHHGYYVVVVLGAHGLHFVPEREKVQAVLPAERPGMREFSIVQLVGL